MPAAAAGGGEGEEEKAGCSLVVGGAPRGKSRRARSSGMSSEVVEGASSGLLASPSIASDGEKRHTADGRDLGKGGVRFFGEGLMRLGGCGLSARMRFQFGRRFVD